MEMPRLARDDHAPPGRRDPMRSALPQRESTIAAAQLDQRTVSGADRPANPRGRKPALDANLEVPRVDAAVAGIGVDLSVEVPGQRDLHRTRAGGKGHRSLICRQLGHPDVDLAVAGRGLDGPNPRVRDHTAAAPPTPP